jgi:hypothetical protein
MPKNTRNTLTKKQLQTLARQQGLVGISQLSKHDLLARLAVVAPSPLSQAPSSNAILSTPSLPIMMALQPETSESKEHREEPAAHVAAAPPARSPLPPLPSTYLDNRIVLLARDPSWLYAYWDFHPEHIRAVQSCFPVQDVQLTLRLLDITFFTYNGANAWSMVDIALTSNATNWYIPLGQPDTTYCVEIGYKTIEGRFAPLGRSNAVTTPRASFSPLLSSPWWTPAERPVAPAPSAERQPVPLIKSPQAEGSWPLGPAWRTASPPLPSVNQWPTPR